MFTKILFLLAFIISGCSSNNSHITKTDIKKPKKEYLKIILPKKNFRVKEGKKVKIKWKTNIKGKVCLQIMLGAHPYGGDECVDAKKGYYIWYIPDDIVESFMDESASEMRGVSVNIYSQKSDSKIYRSNEFTIYK